MREVLTRLYRRAIKWVGPLPIDIVDTRPVHCKQAPSNQTIVDIFRGGWFSAFPDEYGVHTGQFKHFEFSVDPRVSWVDGILPSGVKGLSVLELGPFEAYNTWQFQKLGASPIISIEASNLNYIKCLLVKEVTGLQARFLHGDFIPYLEHCTDKFDIIWASGVLYHQTMPLRLIELIAGHADTIFVHTHYYDREALCTNKHATSFFVPKLDAVHTYRGRRVVLHYRRYPEKKGALFSGGSKAFSYWMEKQDILDLFRVHGFENIDIAVDDVSNPNGPGTCFLARRSASFEGTSDVDPCLKDGK